MRPFRAPAGMEPAARAYLEEVSNTSFLNGHLLHNVALESGANIIPHGLGRKLAGYVVVRKNADENVWDAQDETEQPAMFLELEASGDVTVSIWVF